MHLRSSHFCLIISTLDLLVPTTPRKRPTGKTSLRTLAQSLEVLPHLFFQKTQTFFFQEEEIYNYDQINIFRSVSGAQCPLRREVLCKHVVNFKNTKLCINLIVQFAARKKCQFKVCFWNSIVFEFIRLWNYASSI